jgi:hypothetical protein
MLNRFANWLVPKLEAWCERTGRTHYIYGKDQSKKVYLIRNILFKSPWFCIYIHRFMRSDNDRELHDHPFGFLGYMVKGQYTETRMFGRTIGWPGIYFRDKVWFKTETRQQGSLAFRPANTTHRVALDREYELEEKQEAPLTIILRGPYTREWGFWELLPGAEGLSADSYENFCRGETYRWVRWTEYLGVTEEDAKE